MIADALSAVPVVSAALGPVAGFPAGRLAASHFSVMVKSLSQVMVAGPAVVARALGKQLDTVRVKLPFERQAFFADRFKGVIGFD